MSEVTNENTLFCSNSLWVKSEFAQMTAVVKRHKCSPAWFEISILSFSGNKNICPSILSHMISVTNLFIWWAFLVTQNIYIYFTSFLHFTGYFTFTCTIFGSIGLNSFRLMNLNKVFTWSLNKVIRLMCALMSQASNQNFFPMQTLPKYRISRCLHTITTLLHRFFICF